MKLYLSELKKAEGDFLPYSARLELDPLGTDFSQNEKIILEVDLKAAYVQHQVLLKGKWWAKVRAACGRCLDEFTLLLQGSIDDEFKQLKDSGEKGDGLAFVDEEKGDDFIFRGDVLDLREYFRQLFLIAQPLKILCRNDCKGLCPICGTNKNRNDCDCAEDNIDPRWSMLQKLKEG
ncbi:MAG: YceD family protein [Dethiobacteria bacterium]